MIDEVKAALIEVGRQLHESGLNAGTAGNLSVRLADGRVVMSKRRVRKASLVSTDFVVFDLEFPEGRALNQASTEYRLHLASYRADGGVRSVIHAHPPALTALGLRRSSFPPVLPELEAVVGQIVINSFEPSGSDRLAADVGRAVGRGAGVVILKRHGAVAVGESVGHALDRLELAENAAKTILLAER
jgi:L-fuculose-phosphate aldolase